MRKLFTLKSFLAILFLNVGIGWAFADTYSYEFTSSQFSATGTKTLGDAEWTVDTDAGYWGYDNTKGQHIGSNNKPATYLNFSSNSFAEAAEITSITVNTSGASSTNAEFTVSVGGNVWGSQKLTTTATDYTFTGSNTGEIVLAYTQTSEKAIYIKSITVEYSNTAAAVAAPEFSIPTGVYNESQTVTLTCETADAEIYYTLNGDAPTNESNLYESPLEITETTTVKAIAYVGSEKSSVASATYTIELIKNYGYVRNVTSGKKYVFVADDKLMNPLEESKTYGYLPTSDITATDGYVKAAEKNAFTLTAVEGGYTIQDALGRYYYQEGTYDSYNVSESLPESGHVWTIERQADATVKITNVAKSKYIQYDSNYGSYGCYSTAKGVMPKMYEEDAVAQPESDPVTTFEITKFTPAEGTITGLSEILVEGDLDLQIGANHESVVVYNADGEIASNTAMVNTDGWGMALPSNQLRIRILTTINTNGTYTVHIPQGAICEKGNENNQMAEKDLVYTIGEDVKPFEPTNVVPASGSTVEKLEEVTIYTDYDIMCNEADIVVRNAANETISKVGAYYKDAQGNALTNAVRLVLKTPVTEPGTYTVYIPEGAMYDWSNSKNKIAETTLTYTIAEPEPVVTTFEALEVTPANNATIEKLEDIIIAADCELYGDESVVEVRNANGDVVSKVEFWYKDANGIMLEKKVRLVLKTPVTEPGTYTVYIPQGAIYEWNNTNYVMAETTLTYTVGSGSVTPEPASYIFDASMIADGNYSENVTTGIYTLVYNGKDWIVEAKSGSRFSRDPETKHPSRAKSNGKANYITMEAPSAGTLYIDARASGSNGERHMIITQGEETLLDVIVLEKDVVEVEGYTDVYRTHEAVIPAAGLVTITNPVDGINYYYMEFVPETTVAEDPIMTISPEPGYVESITEFVITCEQGIALSGNGLAYLMSFSGDNDADLVSEVVDENTIKLSVDLEITTPDTYYLNIPAGYFILDPNGAKVSSENIANRPYIIEAEKTTFEASSFNPAAGEVGKLSSIIVTSDEYNLQGADGKIIVRNEAGETIRTSTIQFEDEEGETLGYNQVCVLFDEPVTEPGTYTVYFPEGAISEWLNADNMMAETTLTYIVTGNVVPDPVLVITPAEGEVTELTEITLYCENGLLLNESCEETPWINSFLSDEYWDLTAKVVDANTIKLVLPETITASDSYYLKVPEGYVIMDPNGVAKTNTETMAKYEIPFEGNLELVEATPEDNATVNVLDFILLKFNMNMQESSTAYPTVVDEQGNLLSETTFSYEYNGEEVGFDEIVICLDEPITKSQNVVVIIPAGAISGTDIFVDNEEIRLNYTIVAAAAPQLVVTPALNEEVTSLKEVTLFCENGLALNDACTETPWIQSLVSDGDWTLTPEVVDANTIKLVVPEELTESDTYFLKVPAEYVIMDPNGAAVTNAEVMSMFMIPFDGELELVKATPENNAEVSLLDHVVLTFNMQIGLNYDYDFESGAAPTVVDADGNVLSECTTDFVFNGEYVDFEEIIIVLTTPLTAAQTVEMIIPAGYIRSQSFDLVSEEIRLTYVINGSEGIMGITADPVNGFMVYNMNGVLIMQTKEANDLKSLANGIYIINGKKVFLHNK